MGLTWLGSPSPCHINPQQIWSNLRMSRSQPAGKKDWGNLQERSKTVQKLFRDLAAAWGRAGAGEETGCRQERDEEIQNDAGRWSSKINSHSVATRGSSMLFLPPSLTNPWRESNTTGGVSPA